VEENRMRASGVYFPCANGPTEPMFILRMSKTICTIRMMSPFSQLCSNVNDERSNETNTDSSCGDRDDHPTSDHASRWQNHCEEGGKDGFVFLKLVKLDGDIEHC